MNKENEVMTLDDTLESLKSNIKTCDVSKLIEALIILKKQRDSAYESISFLDDNMLIAVNNLLFRCDSVVIETLSQFDAG